ncbi:MAG: tetratricopeptide repeat protein [Candidatus Nitrosopelagicus sp.]|nr:tetratricopeptide repeat protein [Candidatus Nitrosopelagicus sp.]
MTEIKILIQNGVTHLEDGNFEDALSFFEQALLLESDNPDLWNQKGVVLRSLGRYDEASECYNKSLQLDPRDRASS